MPRLVTKTAKGPLKVGDKKICMCGLSESQPFCDKSHLLTLDEADGKLYWYQDGKREEVIQEGGDCTEDCHGECEGKCQDGQSSGCQDDCHGECGDKGEKECCGGECGCEEVPSKKSVKK